MASKLPPAYTADNNSSAAQGPTKLPTCVCGLTESKPPVRCRSPWCRNTFRAHSLRSHRASL
eukprot:5314641-Pyramimonas_sp.AAC.1